MTTCQVIVIVLAIFLSGGFWFGMQKFCEHRAQAVQVKQKLLMGLGYAQIMYFIRSYLNAGHLTQDDYDELQESLCEPYLKLNGNKAVKAYMSKLKLMIIEQGDDAT